MAGVAVAVVVDHAGRGVVQKTEVVGAAMTGPGDCFRRFFKGLSFDRFLDSH